MYECVNDAVGVPVVALSFWKISTKIIYFEPVLMRDSFEMKYALNFLYRKCCDPSDVWDNKLNHVCNRMLDIRMSYVLYITEKLDSKDTNEDTFSYMFNAAYEKFRLTHLSKCLYKSALIVL